MEEYWKDLKNKSDEEKIAFIERNQYRGIPEDDKLIIALSLENDESKMKVITMLSSERNKARVAVSLKRDENKAKLLGTVITDIFDIEMIKATMKREEKQLEARNKIETVDESKDENKPVAEEELTNKGDEIIEENATTDKELTREKLKQDLIGIGVDEKLLEMPAIMERLYEDIRKFRHYSVDLLFASIDEDGTVLIHGKDKNFIFGLHNNPKKTGESSRENPYIRVLVKLPQHHDMRPLHDDGITYFLDEYGMDKEIYNKMEYIEKMSDADREFLYNLWDGNPNGAPSRYFQRKEEGDNGDYDMKRNSGTWEENKEFLTSHYPITKGWFQGREKDKINDAISQLMKERAEDKEQIERLQKMLEVTLEFCNKVRQSTVGKIFFGKDVKKLPTKNELPEGREER